MQLKQRVDKYVSQADLKMRDTFWNYNYR
jgi:hypothetical protein